QIAKGNKPILSGVRLFAAKDNRNQEVVTVSDNDNDTTGVVSTIEIITDEEDMTLLREYMQEGYELYITYSFQRGNNE
ncbi:hypothetical protein, partial [Leifsonia shinshuensis]|uniref:hypothetical protein n=1 Tax=Leifsonia shinshuensis TaxID=150026 RepID=UPI0035E97671